MNNIPENNEVPKDNKDEQSPEANSNEFPEIVQEIFLKKEDSNSEVTGEEGVEQEDDEEFEEWEDLDRADNDLDDYGRSGEKYGWYNGWSDDAIDDAFEGDPEATWNVD